MKQLYLVFRTIYSCAVLGQKEENSTLNIVMERQLTEAYRIQTVVCIVRGRSCMTCTNDVIQVAALL